MDIRISLTTEQLRAVEFVLAEHNENNPSPIATAEEFIAHHLVTHVVPRWVEIEARSYTAGLSIETRVREATDEQRASLESAVDTILTREEPESTPRR